MDKRNNILSVDLILSLLLIDFQSFYSVYFQGSMSIQEAAVYLVEQYYKDFPVFNPWLENAQQSQVKRHGGFSTKSAGSQSNSSTIAGGTNTRSIRGFNDR